MDAAGWMEFRVIPQRHPYAAIIDVMGLLRFVGHRNDPAKWRWRGYEWYKNEGCIRVNEQYTPRTGPLHPGGRYRLTLQSTEVNRKLDENRTRILTTYHFDDFKTVYDWSKSWSREFNKKDTIRYRCIDVQSTFSYYSNRIVKKVPINESIGALRHQLLVRKKQTP